MGKPFSWDIGKETRDIQPGIEKTKAESKRPL